MRQIIAAALLLGCGAALLRAQGNYEVQVYGSEMVPPARTSRYHALMKILHIITRLIVGGAQENTLLSCQGQAKLGHRVTLVFDAYAAKHKSDIAEPTPGRTSTWWATRRHASAGRGLRSPSEQIIFCRGPLGVCTDRTNW